MSETDSDKPNLGGMPICFIGFDSYYFCCCAGFLCVWEMKEVNYEVFEGRSADCMKARTRRAKCLKERSAGIK
jgi:hypothetical protein